MKTSKSAMTKKVIESEDPGSFEALCEKARQNATSDRSKLEEVVEGMLETGRARPEMMVAISETLVKVIDSMTRSNFQLIQLAQIKAKKDVKKQQTDEKEDLDESEKEDAYGAIGHAYSSSDEAKRGN